MSDSALPQVTELVIARQVGALSNSRGAAYAAAGRVSNLRFDAASQVLTGLVDGSATKPYRVRVVVTGANTARVGVLSATCSCPVAMNCKHVAAVLTAAAKASRDARASEEAVAMDVPDAADWRAALAGIEAKTDTETPKRRLALQFELRSAAPERRAGRVRAPRPAPAGLRLSMRPVMTGARGGWIKGDLSWHNVGYQGRAAGVDPAHARWFAQLNLLKGSVLSGFAEHSSDWITLDTFDSNLLWALLREGEQLGIPLVGSGAKTGIADIKVASSVHIALDASSDDGTLALRPRLVADGHAHDVTASRLIGSHGAYAFDASTRMLTLGRFQTPLTAAQRALFERTEPVTVPAEDVADFVEHHYPSLARTVRVSSADGTFTPPASAPATLVLEARFGEQHELRLHWFFQLDGGQRVPLDAPDAAFLDPRAERAPVAAAAETLNADPAGHVAVTDAGELRSPLMLRHLPAAEFTARLLPQLESLERVRVDVVGDKPDYREVEERPVLTVSAVEGESNDWFDLGVMVTVEGRAIPFGPLFRALSSGAKKLLLIDNSYLSLNQPVFDPLRELIEEAGSLEEWETGIRISRYQTELFAEFEDLADHSEAAASWRAIVEGLRDLESVPPTEVPEGFAGELRPYQRVGFEWLAFLWRERLGGILADDMGLGKTAQTLALIAYAAEQRRGDGPFLVVAPTSVVSNWAREAARFVPGLRVASITETSGKSGVSVADAAAGADLVLTTYAILRLNEDEFVGSHWGGVVLDEAQFAKNPSSRVHRAATALRAPFRLAVTGTPIENNLTELWALLAFAAPGLFPSARQFAEKYRRPIEVGHDVERLSRLRRRVRPFMLRRTKESVAPELPPKQEQVLEVTLEPRHRRVYDTYLQRERQKVLGLVDDLDRNRFIVFRSLTLLRMLSLDAALIDPERFEGVPSAKLDALLDHLDDVVGEGHRALVFSQFTSFLGRAADRLNAHGISHSYLDGSTRGRGKVIDEFRSGKTNVFLISLKAGGFGLNLTEADYVFILDPWWNPATEAQAVDRAHRIGQTSQVMVYRMVATGTIEEKVMALKAKKAELFSAVLDDDAFFAEALSADDIRGLLDA